MIKNDKIKILALFTITAFSFLTSYSIATNHYVSGRDSVDDREIRYTTYFSEKNDDYKNKFNFGKQVWNNYGDIDILPDTWWTWNDLEVYDVEQPLGPLTLGRWLHFGNNCEDGIQIAPLAAQVSSDIQKNLFTHELGHALGLSHSISGNIMGPFPISQTFLGSQDKSDYDYLWD